MTVGSDMRTIEGYVAVFNQPEMISDAAGEYQETIARGAFRYTLAGRDPSVIRMQWDHGYDPAIGSVPVGEWVELVEDTHGLRGTGRLFDTPSTDRLRQALAAGVVTGASIRFRVPKGGADYRMEGSIPARVVRQVNLLEAGPVLWPAYPGASVGVRRRPRRPTPAAERRIWQRRLRAAALRGGGVHAT